jgi:hypothetical protein
MRRSAPVMPMPSSPSPKDHAPEPRSPLLRRLERAAGELNPFLTILAIGIAVLDLTCYMGVVGSRQLAPHSVAYAASSASGPEAVDFRSR